MRELTDLWESFDHIVVLDTNVFFHFQPIQNIPWGSVVGEGSVLILVLPQVMIEVDKRKRDAKLHRRARDIHVLIRQVIETGSSVQFCSGNNSYQIYYLPIVPVNWSETDLDRHEGDQRLVAEMLSISGLPREKLVFLGHDAYPIGIAKGHGIAAKFLSDTFLLPPEANPAERTIIELRERLALSEASQPSYLVSCELSHLWEGHPVRVAQASTEHAKTLANLAVLKQPKQVDLFGSIFPERKYSEDELFKYNKNLFSKAREINRRAEAVLNQYSARVKVKNCSGVMSDSTVLSIRSEGARFIEAPLIPEFWPPKRPSLRDNYSTMLGIRDFNMRPMKIDPLELYFDFSNSSRGEVVCSVERFMPEREFSFELISFVAGDIPDLLKFEVCITAKNFRGVDAYSCEIDLVPVSKNIEDVCDMSAGVSLLPTPAEHYYREKWIDTDQFGELNYLDEI